MACAARASSPARSATCKTLALAAALLNVPCALATSETDALKEEIRRLSHRIEQLEATEKKRAAAGKGKRETVKQDVGDLKERIGDVETQVQALNKPSRLQEALDGVNVNASLTMVGQRALNGTTSGGDDSQLNYRGDLTVEVPLDSFGKLAGVGDSKLFAHLRAGQGAGLKDLNPTLTATPNTTAFFLEQDNNVNSTVLLAQLWYQFGIPLARSSAGRLPRIEGTFGKVDVFGFFDQNAVADDETESFMNNVFVHNPLLDSGGDIGADSYGFAPGVVASYTTDTNSVNRWKFSLGMFGSGAGSGFDTSFNQPLVMAQAEVTGRLLGNRPGTYRFYGWTNGQTTPFNDPEDSATQRHSGVGLSIDQEIARQFSLFARYGHSTTGQVQFKNSFTLGGQLGGMRWGRAEDRIGLAFGWLDPSKAFKAAAPTYDANGNGVPDFGFTPSGAETDIELYYAWQINKNLQLTPSFQWIGRPGGDSSASDISIIGLRAKAGF